MAINLKTFWKRFWVAVGIIIPVVAFPIYFGGLWLLIFGLGIMWLSVFELLSMYKAKYAQLPNYFWIAYPLVALSLLTSYFYPQVFLTPIMILLVLLLTIFFMVEIFFSKDTFFKKYYLGRVLIYIGLFMPYLFLIRVSEQGLLKIFLLMLMVSFYDIFAYIVGVTIGRHRFLPTISPKKSVEGCLGGFLGMIFGSYLFCSLFSVNAPELSSWQWAGFLFIAAVLAQFGDLVESAIKRNLTAKDSGGVIPGHGGILDRIDAFILISPSYLLFINLVM